MLSVTLNIIGIILILYSIYIIRRDLTEKKISEYDLDSVEKRVKEYYHRTEDIIEDFDGLIEAKLDMINTENILDNNKKMEPMTYKDINTIVNYNMEAHESIDEIINPIHKKIIDLKTIGLTNEEIAKKLNKGVREIEIVLKMQRNNKR